MLSISHGMSWMRPGTELSPFLRVFLLTIPSHTDFHYHTPIVLPLLNTIEKDANQPPFILKREEAVDNVNVGKIMSRLILIYGVCHFN